MMEWEVGLDIGGGGGLGVTFKIRNPPLIPVGNSAISLARTRVAPGELGRQRSTAGGIP